MINFTLQDGDEEVKINAKKVVCIKRACGQHYITTGKTVITMDGGMSLLVKESYEAVCGLIERDFSSEIHH